LEGLVHLSGFAPVVTSLDAYRVINLPVSGGDDTTGIAALGSTYATTDAFEEDFEIRQLTAPYTLVASLSLDHLRSVLGVPVGSTSGGPDGMTSVSVHGGFYYVIAVSPFSTDAIYRIALDGSTAELFANREIFDRGDYFNDAEIEFYSD